MSDAKPNHHIEIDVKTMQVKLWDLGPSKPVPPVKPEPPKGKDGDPDYELAKIEFRDLIEEYAAALKAHKRDKDWHKAWWEENGGPIQVQAWSVDAKEMLERAPERYVTSLPKNLKPGPGHQRALEREQNRATEFAAGEARDPHFGTSKGIAA